MLPDRTIPASLTGLLAVFRPAFTAPTFRTFTGLTVGVIAQTRRRTVCGMLTGAGLERLWQHSRAHRFFAVARWSADMVGLALVDLIVARPFPAGSPITIAVDDTLFKRSGKKVFGVAWHHDGAAKGPKPIGFGNCWVRQLLGRGRHRCFVAVLVSPGLVALKYSSSLVDAPRSPAETIRGCSCRCSTTSLSVTPTLATAREKETGWISTFQRIFAN